ncbi:hypothetical protein RFN28_28455 [Mesorhizobium sp. VK24D]|uniref:Tat (Twin-arginine translocation) pathway signal sequence n=1 Tax=Mesorhizobium album TaxID=3072314 RepID=A0ABU4Y6J1_9HYPH|nr:hypothetical protein [Mesorhizobium sp. VK24D]MDX8482361.1 hypothetical protein [Mesorhizobium sp. VK24D]
MTHMHETSSPARAAVPSRRKAIQKIGLAALGLAMAATDLGGLAPFSFVSEAQARIGAAWTPRSAAGVARRTTTWRVLRHTTAWVATLPAGCVRTKVNGFDVWRCGGTYYRLYQGRYIVVVVD